MTGDVTVVIAQCRQILLKRADGSAGRAELQVCAGGRTGRTARVVDRRGNRAERLRARNAISRQTLRLLERLDRRFRLGAVVAGDFRVIVTQLLQIILKLGDLAALAVELERRSADRGRCTCAALAGNRRRDCAERLCARDAVSRQTVRLLERLDSRFRLRAVVTGNLRIIVAQRRQILLQIADRRAGGIERKHVRASGRRSRSSALRLICCVNLCNRLRTRDAVGSQAVLILKRLDGGDGLGTRVAGDRTGIEAQRLELGLNALDGFAAGVLSDVGVIRIGGTRLALGCGKRADLLAGQVSAADVKQLLRLIRAENLDIRRLAVVLADPAGFSRSIAGAILHLNKGIVSARLGRRDIHAGILDDVVDNGRVGRCGFTDADSVLRLTVDLAVIRGAR